MVLFVFKIIWRITCVQIIHYRVIKLKLQNGHGVYIENIYICPFQKHYIIFLLYASNGVMKNNTFTIKEKGD